MSNLLALNGEIAPAPTVGVLQRGVLRRPVELTPPKATAKADMVEPGGRATAPTPLALCAQISTCSDMARASSISMPRYRTVLSIFVCPSRS